ncbi:PPE family protein [Streptomyces sp. CC228A]|uniref:PPE family protein n=1 Tax=Streptomyces sp. CC228A TaxID=2898186 RepID=UPI001F4061F2|nr:PPE family protein [Streptomyces sp. CC228A]
MALTYKKVMSTDYGKLTAAAKAWDDMAAELKKAESAYAAATKGLSLGAGNWQGLAQSRAYANFEGTQYEYGAAQTQARAIAGLLRDAHGQFTELKQRLESVVADARKDKMAVDAEGSVRPDLSADVKRALVHDPDGQTLLAQYNRAAQSWEQQIQKYVKAFEDADAGVKLALTTAVKDSNKESGGKDATPNGFNAGAKSDIEQYELEYAKDVTTRLNNGDKVSTAEVDNLSRILRDNNNEAFEHRTKWGQTFLSSLGADGTLKLANKLNDFAYFESTKERGSYLAVQKGLANTISAATQVPPFKRDGKVLEVGSRAYAEEFAKWRSSDNGRFYDTWTEDIRKAGTKEYDTIATQVHRATIGDQKALGYQSLVTLMQHGDGYSAPFLLDLAEGIRTAEDPTRGGDKNIWDVDHKFDAQKPGKTDGWFANDPLDGLLGVMSRTPDAATAYFDSQSYWPAEGDRGIRKFDDNLEYLQTKRDWEVVNEYKASHKDGMPVYRGDVLDADSHVGFGAALEAATTGHAPGTPVPEDFTKHTAAQARVLQDVITSYAEITKVDQSAMPENIRVNMANSLAYYPADVHEILVSQVDLTGAGYATDTNGLSVSTETMNRFIRGVAEDGGAFRVVHDSQIGHISERIGNLTADDFKHTPKGENDAARGIAHDAGKTMGQLDYIRADVLGDQRDNQISQNNWAKVYNYHTSGIPVTGIPVVGDTIQRMIDIGTGKHAEALNNDVAGKTKEQLIEHYERNGYPRLEQMINTRAESLMISQEDIKSREGRLGDIRRWAESSYGMGINRAEGSAGERR